MITIYLISNTVNNKLYVGQTSQTIGQRFTRHCWQSNFKRQVISQAICKYGKDKFSISEIDKANSLEEANEKEVYWALFYNCFAPNGYNLKAGGRKYLHMANETKTKISKAHSGKRASWESRKRMSEAHIGQTMSEETRKKLSKTNKGKAPSENTRKAILQKCAKKYLFRNPSGEEIEIINLKKFCQENNLVYTTMCTISKDPTKQYKGWRIISSGVFMGVFLGSRRRDKKIYE